MPTSTTTNSAAPARAPQRRCVACGARRDKGGLIRLVRGAGGDGAPRLRVDERARAGGRGAYLCPRAECWARAADGKALARALRGPIAAADLATLRGYAEGRFAADGAAAPAAEGSAA